MATTLPPSSPNLALDIDLFESNEISQDSLKSCQELNDGDKFDEGDVLKCDYGTTWWIVMICRCCLHGILSCHGHVSIGSYSKNFIEHLKHNKRVDVMMYM